MHHVIIGAGPAGVIAAETLRKIDPSSSVAIIGEETEAPYSRMALPYYLIEKIGEEGTFLRKTPSHYSDKGIDIIQDRVSVVNTDSKTLSLENGDDVSFDKLLIATGSHPVSPPIPGLDLPGIHPCWTLEDGRNIIKRAQPGSNVVLMGAGFIGCIILEALALRKVNLTVIEMEDRMVPRMMNQISGNLIKQWCIDKGVAVYTSTRVEAIEKGADDRLKVKLDNGKVLDADLVISATGVRSNIQF
ncbi:MAG: NAD(P)/FAD-dependent oxidoreductase, partial [Gammaproteobacteria bacterium]|nr:NAD(P)/FAD-dependent oxidoreductase [Gammaproteobacteria bacterium]